MSKASEKETNRFENANGYRRITLCGSSKFKKEFDVVNRQLTLAGHIVYTPAIYGHYENLELPKKYKEILDEVHLRKIASSDTIVVIDFMGYIGESTEAEIQYAKDHGRNIYYFQQKPNYERLL